MPENEQVDFPFHNAERAKAFGDNLAKFLKEQRATDVRDAIAVLLMSAANLQAQVKLVDATMTNEQLDSTVTSLFASFIGMARARLGQSPTE